VASVDLHLVCLDNPYPPDYGGAIDMYYKWKALHELGLKIAVHIFHKPHQRQQSPDIPAEKIFYYQRKLGFSAFLHPKPYIIRSRNSKELLQNLQTDDSPILFEGIHVTECLPFLKGRKTAIRVHNIESEYYAELARSEPDFKKRLFFQTESWKLHHWEQKIWQQAMLLFPVSQQEHIDLQSAGRASEWIPAFLPDEPMLHRPRSDSTLRLLFHGNMQVRENLRSAQWLIQNIVPQLPQETELTIAGKGADRITSRMKNVRLISNPKDMASIIARADAVVIPTLQTSGVKLKVLTSLQQHKPVLTTPQGIIGSGLEQDFAPFTYQTAEELLTLIHRLKTKDTSAWNELWQRFDKLYGNRQNATLLWGKISNPL
jgi:glycosyltransferase involved in cell wall biosynthesis